MSEPAIKSTGRRGVRASSPPSTPIFGHARAFQRDPLGFLMATARSCGPVARLKLGPLTYHFVTEPALVSEILQERASNYLRDTRSSRSIRLVTGESLLTAEGEAWRRHRRLAQPVFHHQHLAQLARAMAVAAAETAVAWEKTARDGGTLDLVSEMSRLTFAVVGRCLFGAELGAEAGAVEAALPLLLDELFRRTKRAVTLPMWMPSRRHRTFKHALGVVDEVVARIIAARRSARESRTDLLGMLLNMRDEDGSALRDEELRNQVVTFLLAGHETTASLLTWAFALLAKHPHEQRAVETELNAAGISREGALPLEAVQSLSFTNAVLNETARLYPSIWIAERRVVATDELGGYSIPAGSSVVVAPYVTHRLPEYWPEPEEFRPSRFRGDATHTLEGDGYFPFGAGPHACVGQHFALMEARIILATFSARFRLSLVEPALPAAHAGITLRPSRAIAVRVERRPL